METRCVACGKALRVADEFAGGRARCPQCGTIYQVPWSETDGGDGVSVALADGSRDAAPEADAGDPALADTQPWRPASDVRWSLRIEDGRVFGPVHKSEMDSWVAEGRVGVHHEIRREDDDQWRSATFYFPRSTLIDSNSGGAREQRGFAEPRRDTFGEPFTRAAPAESHRGPLVLTLGIVGLFVWVVALVALVLGLHDLRRISDGHMDVSGRSRTSVGVILGIIGIAKFGIVTLFRIFS